MVLRSSLPENKLSSNLSHQYCEHLKKNFNEIQIPLNFINFHCVTQIDFVGHPDMLNIVPNVGTIGQMLKRQELSKHLILSQPEAYTRLEKIKQKIWFKSDYCLYSIKRGFPSVQ